MTKWAGRRLTRMVGPLAALLLIALVARRIVLDWQRMPPEGLAAFRIAAVPLVVAWAVQTLGWFLAVDIWRRMVSALDASLTWWEHARLYTYSALAQVVPGSIWVPASRLVAYRQAGVGTWAISAALGLEWALVGLAGLLVLVGAAPFGPWAIGSQWLSLAALALVAVVLWGPRRSWAKVRSWLANRFDLQGLAGVGRRSLVAWLAAEAGVVVLGGIALHLFMLGLTQRGGLAMAIGVSALTGALFAWLTWMPFTSVVRAGLMVMLLSEVYHSSVIALALVIAWRIWCLILGLVWAILAAVAARHQAPAARREATGEDERR